MNLVCVMVGGTETLPKIVAPGLMELSRHPGQLAEVRADLPANCKVAIEEMNRFCGPAQWFLRTARKDTTIAGTLVRAGQRRPPGQAGGPRPAGGVPRQGHGLRVRPGCRGAVPVELSVGLQRAAGGDQGL
jgi:hypothetical protein